MRRGLTFVALLLIGVSAANAAPSKSETKQVAEAARVIGEIRSAPDKGIPDNLWERARCVVVMPGVKKAALVIGGEYGKGVASCRTNHGWSAPVFMTLEKGSFGAQIGAQATDVVLLVMNDRGINRLLQDKVTLGADLSLAAGPVGRSGTAATDAQLGAELLSYSRSRGLFAGIDLSGGMIRTDAAATNQFYGRSISGRDVLLGQAHVAAPSVSPLLAALRGAPQGHHGKS